MKTNIISLLLPSEELPQCIIYLWNLLKDFPHCQVDAFAEKTAHVNNGQHGTMKQNDELLPIISHVFFH